MRVGLASPTKGPDQRADEDAVDGDPGEPLTRRPRLPHARVRQRDVAAPRVAPLLRPRRLPVPQEDHPVLIAFRCELMPMRTCPSTNSGLP